MLFCKHTFDFEAVLGGGIRGWSLSQGLFLPGARMTAAAGSVAGAASRPIEQKGRHLWGARSQVHPLRGHLPPRPETRQLLCQPGLCAGPPLRRRAVVAARGRILCLPGWVEHADVDGLSLSLSLFLSSFSLASLPYLTLLLNVYNVYATAIRQYHTNTHY